MIFIYIRSFKSNSVGVIKKDLGFAFKHSFEEEISFKDVFDIRT
jgi:hypothetical protein